MRRAAARRLLFLSIPLVLFACETEFTRRQTEELRQVKAERERVERENEEMRAATKKAEQQQQVCNRAFRSFEKAQAASDPRDAVALYREGLKLCPDDDVAHYELGKILAGMGRSNEARQEFEAALKINPNFNGAKQEMRKLQKK